MITKIKKAIQYFSVRCYELKISIKEFRRGSKLSSDAFESFYKNGMLVEVHSVEKGLGLKNTKPGHSSKPVTNLINKMFGYIGRGYDPTDFAFKLRISNIRKNLTPRNFRNLQKSKENLMFLLSSWIQT